MSLARFKKRKDPAPVLRAETANTLLAEQVADALGLSIEVHGRHVELENGMRGTYKGARLVWCHPDGTGIGDNCALAQAVTGLEFRPMLELLLGYVAANPVNYMPAATDRKVLRMPRTCADDEQRGREYLRGRGISNQAIAAAEAAGMLEYTGGAVLFVGYDADGTTHKSATRRGYLPTDPAPKRDLSGSDKSFAAVLPGDVAEVWLVEGGADALALHTLHPRPPTVIVTGGSRARAWIEQPHLQQLLKRAWRVVIAGENERTSEIQASTDADRDEQARRISAVANIEVLRWQPPAGVKDLADFAARRPPSAAVSELLKAH